MREGTVSFEAPPVFSERVRSALDLIQSLVIEGIKHGHFEYSVSCEAGTHGRRVLIVKAGKSHRFSIMEEDVPR